MKKLFTLSLIIFLTLKVSGQYFDIRKMVRDQGIDINQIHPRDLLGYGIGNCDLELIKSAIKNGADLNKELSAGSYILPLVGAINMASDALLPGEESKLASQIRDYGSEVYSGRTVNELRRDYIEIIRFLLQNGAEVNVSPDFSSGGIPLLRAAECLDIEIIKLLLDSKADPNYKDSSGSTALGILGSVTAFSWPYKNTTEIAKLLVSKGAKVTPDHLARAKTSLDQIQSNELSFWRDFPFYNDLVNSLKSLIDFYSKIIK